MGRSPVVLAATRKKIVLYCKTVVGAKSNCVCSPGQDVGTVLSQTFPDVRMSFFSTEGRFLVSKTNNHGYEKVDVKRVAAEIQEDDEPLPINHFSRIGLCPIWRPCMRLVEATFFRHLYRKCDFCTYFTSDIGALHGYQCPHCSREASPELYVAQRRRPEQPMHSVWYRSAPTSFMVTDDLESYPLSHHKELCNTSDFLFKRRKLRKTDEDEKIHDHCLSPDEVLKKLGEWEDLI